VWSLLATLPLRIDQKFVKFSICFQHHFGGNRHSFVKSLCLIISASFSLRPRMGLGRVLDLSLEMDGHAGKFWRSPAWPQLAVVSRFLYWVGDTLCIGLLLDFTYLVAHCDSQFLLDWLCAFSVYMNTEPIRNFSMLQVVIVFEIRYCLIVISYVLIRTSFPGLVVASTPMGECMYFHTSSQTRMP
jgi:hypothetical protein